MKVILFCPVRERAEVFGQTLEAHQALWSVSDRWYFDDNTDSRTRDLLALDPRAVVLGALDTISAERPEYENHRWRPEIVSRVAMIKDAAIERFLSSDADFLFLVDADVIPHPAMVAYLVSLNLPVVSEVYWSQWSDSEPWMPNVWDRHTYQFDAAEHVTRLATPGVYRVGGLGACTLIRRDVLAAGARFASVQGLDCWGEDRHFCTRVAVLGFGMFADTHYPPFHVYRPEQYNEMQAWRALGSDVSYFRDTWLTDGWKAAVEASTRPRLRRVVAVAAPGESCSSAWWVYFWKLAVQLGRLGFDLIPFNGFSSNPSITRQAIADDVLACPEPIEFVLWMDDDNILSADQFLRLVADLDGLPENSAVAGWAWIDLPTPLVSAGIFSPDGNVCRPIPAPELFKAAALIPVEYTGFPAVLMRRSLLASAGELPFAYIPSPSRWGFHGEDCSFCVHARERCGAAFYVDPRVFVPHLKGKALGISGRPAFVHEAVDEAAGWLAGKLSISLPVSETAVGTADLSAGGGNGLCGPDLKRLETTTK